MNLFHTLEEHAQVFYEMAVERLHHQVHSYGGADGTLLHIVDTLKAHLVPTMVEEVVAEAEAVVEEVVESVEGFIAEAAHLGGLGE